MALNKLRERSMRAQFRTEKYNYDVDLFCQILVGKVFVGLKLIFRALKFTG